jgi:hypothetical protein
MVVRLPLEDMPRGWDEFVDHARVDRRLIGGDVDRRRAAAQRWRMSEQHGHGGVRIPGLDDLTVLIDRPVQIGPATGDLDIRLVNRPSIPDRVPCRTGGVDQLGTHIYAASRYTFDLGLLSYEAFLALRSRRLGRRRCDANRGTVMPTRPHHCPKQSRPR